MPMDVTRTYLELNRPEQLQPASSPVLPGVRLARLPACEPSFYGFLYHEVGQHYHWRDRRDWTDGQIRTHLARPEISIWLLTLREESAGWFELAGHEDGSVEIAYLGLLPRFHGRGLGKHLLTETVRRAWERGANRVWLHTCSLDAPAALPNYLARGFRPFREEVYQVSLTAPPPAARR